MRNSPIALSLAAVIAACEPSSVGAPADLPASPPLFSFHAGPPDERSPSEDLALNSAGTGFPSPLESDPGWGGGSFPWEMVDGFRQCPKPCGAVAAEPRDAPGGERNLGYGCV